MIGLVSDEKFKHFATAHMLWKDKWKNRCTKSKKKYYSKLAYCHVEKIWSLYLMH